MTTKTLIYCQACKQFANSFVCWVIFHVFCCLLIFLKINFFKNFFQEYHQSIKQFGSRSGLTFCQAWPGSKTVCKCYQQTALVCVCTTLLLKFYLVNLQHFSYKHVFNPLPHRDALQHFCKQSRPRLGSSYWSGSTLFVYEIMIHLILH